MKQKLNKSKQNVFDALRNLSAKKTLASEQMNKKEERVEEGPKKHKEEKADRKEKPIRHDSPNLNKLSALVSSQKKSAASRLKELGVDVETLLESDAEEGDERVPGEKELAKKGKKGGLQGNPSPTPPADLNAMLDLERIVGDMPENPRDMNRGILSYLNKLQYLALAKAERMLTCISGESASELVKLATALKDMQLTIKWTKKMEQVILNNPSKMKPPGVGGGFRLLDKLTMLSKSAKQEADADRRTSGARNSAAANPNLELPSDNDAPSKQAGGA